VAARTCPGLKVPLLIVRLRCLWCLPQWHPPWSTWQLEQLPRAACGTHTHTQTHAHARAHTRTHTRSRLCTHTHTCTHTLPSPAHLPWCIHHRVQTPRSMSARIVHEGQARKKGIVIKTLRVPPPLRPRRRPSRPPTTSTCWRSCPRRPATPWASSSRRPTMCCRSSRTTSPSACACSHLVVGVGGGGLQGPGGPCWLAMPVGPLPCPGVAGCRGHAGSLCWRRSTCPPAVLRVPLPLTATAQGLAWVPPLHCRGPMSLTPGVAPKQKQGPIALCPVLSPPGGGGNKPGELGHLVCRCP